MPSLTAIIASLGTAGAVANARAVLEQRDREELAVEHLLTRLAQPDGEEHTVSAAA